MVKDLLHDIYGLRQLVAESKSSKLELGGEQPKHMRSLDQTINNPYCNYIHI